MEDTTTAGEACKLLEELPARVAGLYSSDPKDQHEAVHWFRKLLQAGVDAPKITAAVVASGVIPRFVGFLGGANSPEVQYEAAWVLINVTGSRDPTHAQLVVDAGAVPALVALLSSADNNVQLHAVWALGNIAGDSPAHRDVLSHDPLPLLLEQLGKGSSVDMVRRATWTLSNLCRGTPPPDYGLVSQALPTLARLLHHTHEEVLGDACWALEFLSNKGDHDRIQHIVDAGVCSRLVELLRHSSEYVLVPALRTVGNIVGGNYNQVQAVVDSGGLPALRELVARRYRSPIQKEACWILSNITTSSSQHVQAVMDSDIILPLILLMQHACFPVAKEAAGAISIAASTGTHEQVRYLVQAGAIQPLCDMLAVKDTQIVNVAVEGLAAILQVGDVDRHAPGSDGRNLYAQLVRDVGGLDKLEVLQGHQNQTVAAKAAIILAS